jgi:hypothetical protein
MRRDSAGVSNAQLGLFSIEYDRERTLERYKGLFTVETMRIAQCSWSDLKPPGAKLRGSSTWGRKPKKVKAIKVKVRGLRCANNGHGLFSLSD